MGSIPVSEKRACRLAEEIEGIISCKTHGTAWTAAPCVRSLLRQWDGLREYEKMVVGALRADRIGAVTLPSALRDAFNEAVRRAGGRV